MKNLRLSVMACAVSALALCLPSQARITRIVIDETVPLARAADGSTPVMAYEQLAGRAFGELDPKLPGNAIIQDIELAKEADGRVRYVTSFVINKPVDMSLASGLMWHDVPDRGRLYPVASQELAFGDVLLASAWQGDNSGATAVKDKATTAGLQWLKLPVARVAGRAHTAAERKANTDPRPLLAERYGSHDGYVAALEKGTERAVREGFLLPVDAAALVNAAQRSAVLQPVPSKPATQ
jgi:Alpha/beta hydrolase domain